MIWTLKTVREFARAVDPNARVSTRGLPPGAYSIRTNNELTAMLRAIKLAGFDFDKRYDHTIEGTRWEPVHVLFATDPSASE
jgi:hypothetical protein